jgi:hypothetical protein
MAFIVCPLHGIDFCKVAAKDATRAREDFGKWGNVFGDVVNCERRGLEKSGREGKMKEREGK